MRYRDVTPEPEIEIDYSEQLPLMPIPAPWRPTNPKRRKAKWERWHGEPTSCDQCVADRASSAVEMDLLRALWRVEFPGGLVRLLCSVHAARAGR